MQPGLVTHGKAILCAIDVETTGVIPGHHEIWQIAMVPVTVDLTPWDGPPFYVNVRPEYPERASIQALRTCGITDEQFDAFPEQSVVEAQFYDWHANLGLPADFRLLPLWHNGRFDESFLRVFFGDEAFDELFTIPARDTFPICAFLNDQRAFRGQNAIFGRLTLELVAKRLGVDVRVSHDALADCLTNIEVYRLLCEMF